MQYLNLKDDLWYDCLEDSYGYLRHSWHSQWVGMPIILDDCLKFLNLHHNNLSEAAKSMLDAAKSVALEIENQAQGEKKKNEPKYHNRLHFADAITSISIQLAILNKAQKQDSHDWMMCALLTCLSHDFGHPGKVNSFESEIEIQSVDSLKPILISHSVPEEWITIIETAIVRSDFAIVHRNHADVAAKSFDWNLNWLCVLLNEADVMASASSKYGPNLGNALAQEWQLIGFPPHAIVSSLEGRNSFLKQVVFSSPASLILGLNQKIEEEIRTNLTK
jgi:hypothetical protein